ncbi:Mce protein [Candidatus Mycobacterium wuenschmannii]|uniref:Mce protein n=1 Tax=Candidatus Mycobacterium wuenschmannii TaxID=3027808 RepID=A0ABY8VV97_9MYCO|nr:Mce protein [Candidatus Mycobacterium wuenschmannii]WIM86981.1 Mce protein [Candidatus Mycobacterium wuenschmannii]
MEGDAGASQLTPNETDEDPSLEPDSVTDESTADESTEDSTESDAADESETEHENTEVEDDPRGPSRLGRAWFIGIAAGLVVVAGGIGAGGYFALRAHQESQATAHRDALALEAAKDCVGATQAPDIGAMATSAQKIIECGAGAFRSQAILYSGLLVEAYQAANAHVEVSDLRGAVERNNPDGSVEILVPLRVKVSNADSENQEAGYRLRVTMVQEEGKYRIAKLDQVAR